MYEALRICLKLQLRLGNVEDTFVLSLDLGGDGDVLEKLSSRRPV